MAQQKQDYLTPADEEIISAILAKEKLTHEEMVWLNKKNPKVLFDKKRLKMRPRSFAHV